MSNKWVTGLQNKASQLVTEKLNIHKWNSKYFKYYEIIWTYSLEGLFKVNMWLWEDHIHHFDFKNSKNNNKQKQNWN